jgi:uncharacterized membrane protein
MQRTLLTLLWLLFLEGGITDANAHQEGFLEAGGTFSSVVVPGAFDTFASSINDVGQIVGSFGNGRGSAQGFLESNNNFTTIAVPGQFATHANAINDSGRIVGDSNFSRHGYMLDAGKYTTIDPAETVNLSEARGINDAGQIVGNFGTSSGLVRSYLYVSGQFTTIQAPGAIDTSAASINNAGQIVGSFYDGKKITGFLYAAGKFNTIAVPGAFQTFPLGINDTGDIVGDFIDATGTHGFLDAGGKFTAIDVPNGIQTIASGINNLGQIVGAFEPIGSIPEPGLLLFTIAGLLMTTSRLANAARSARASSLIFASRDSEVTFLSRSVKEPDTCAVGL